MSAKLTLPMPEGETVDLDIMEVGLFFFLVSHVARMSMQPPITRGPAALNDQ